MKRNDVKLMTGTLADFLEAGIEMPVAVSKLKNVLPKYSNLWLEASERLALSSSLSEVLEGHVDDSFIAVIRAGEGSGKVTSLLRDIEETIMVEEEVSSHLSQIYYPLILILGGVGCALFFLIKVIPSMAGSLGDVHSPIVSFSLRLSESFYNNFTVYIISLICLVAFIIHMLGKSSVRSLIVDSAMNIRLLRSTITQLQFGVWTRYLSLILSSGIPTIDALRISENILNGKLRQVIILIRTDLENNISMEDVVDMEKLPHNDPRREYIPFFVSNAFITGSQTAQIGKALGNASPTLIKQGVRLVKRITKVGGIVATAIAAIAIVMPMGVVFNEMLNALDNL